jgi:hypothetical protein
MRPPWWVCTKQPTQEAAKTIEIAELPDACLHAPSREMPGCRRRAAAHAPPDEVKKPMMPLWRLRLPLPSSDADRAFRTSSRTWTPLLANEAVVSAIAASAAGAGMCRRLHPPQQQIPAKKMDRHGTSTRYAVPENGSRQRRSAPLLREPWGVEHTPSRVGLLTRIPIELFQGQSPSEGANKRGD